MKTITPFGKWMALTAALLGWLFDGLEMGLFPLVAAPALRDLLSSAGETPSKEQIDAWLGVITALFLVGAATGGVLFGWIGDRFGRVRAMMLSVATYALVSGLCGFATSAWQVGVLRFIASLGMGGEWSLGVALINELWPDRSRAFLAGLMGAAGNVGYMIIGVIGLGLAHFIEDTRAVMLNAGLAEGTVNHLLAHNGWRFLMMLGAVPALLTFFIRIFVPESARWEHERDKGVTSHWMPADLLGVLVGGLGAIAIIVVWVKELPMGLRVLFGQAGIYVDPQQMDLIVLSLRVVGSIGGFYVALRGYTYPVKKFLMRSDAAESARHDNLAAAVAADPALLTLHRPAATFRRMIFAACLSGVALLGTWGSVQQAPPYANRLIEKNETAAWEAKNERKLTNLDPEERKLVQKDIRDVAQIGSTYTQMASALGAVIGTIIAALLANAFGRRITYFALCVGSLAIIPSFYYTRTEVDTTYYLLALLMGAITAAFYGWLPLYLPEIFRTSVRATGQGFGFNFGRILAAIGVLQLGNISEMVGGLANACAVLSLIYLVGMVLIWFTPETRGQPLPE